MLFRMERFFLFSFFFFSYFQIVTLCGSSDTQEYCPTQGGVLCLVPKETP